MRATIILGIVAVVIAGAVAFGAWQFLQRPPEPVAVEPPPPLPTVRVVVAAIDLPAGHVIIKENLRWQAWPEEAVDATFVTSKDGEGKERLDDFVGTTVRRGIAAGEPVILSRVFKREEAGFLAGALSPGMRAVSVRIDAVSGTAGFILPGDRVDVILTQNVAAGGEAGAESAMTIASETLLQGVRVLAIDQNPDDIAEAAQLGSTATLEVTPKQAEIIAVATAMGQLSLALRSITSGRPDDYSGPFTSDVEISQALGGGLAAATRRAQTVESEEPAPAQPRIVAADRDLPQGTLIRDSDLRLQALPQGASAEGYFVVGQVGREDLRGAWVKVALAAGDPVTAVTIIRPDEPGFLAAALNPGTRAVSIGLTPVSGLSGLVAPGDRVDVVLTRQQSETGEGGGAVERSSSETILEDIRVLALGRGGETATVEVTPEQAARLTVAMTLGRITLALRSLAPGEETTGTVFASESDVSRVPRPAAAPVQPMEAPLAATRVLAATRPLPQGTLLRDSDVRWQAVPEGWPVEGYFIEGRDPLETLRGALVKEDVALGEPLVAENLSKPGEPGFLTGAIAPGLRAVSIAIDAVSGVAGFISPGDRVDVVMTIELTAEEEEGEAGPSEESVVQSILDPRRFSERVLHNIRVLAIERTVDSSSGQPVVGQTATVEVTPKQAEILALAASMGELSLALRGTPTGEPLAVEPSFTTDLEISVAASEFIAQLVGLAELMHAPVEPAAAAPAEPTGSAPPVEARSAGTVRVYRAVEAVTLEFSE